jgi:predicted nucleotidyltransferase
MKDWPEFNEHGDLPVGIHQATLVEVVEHFGSRTPQRRAVAQRLTRVYDLAQGTGHVDRVIIYGSFVTSKASPNDVDIFLLVDDTFDKSLTSGETAAIFDHLTAENKIGASVFWMRHLSILDSEQELIEHWQIKRDLTRRGIVEVTRRD